MKLHDPSPAVSMRSLLLLLPLLWAACSSTGSPADARSDSQDAGAAPRRDQRIPLDAAADTSRDAGGDAPNDLLLGESGADGVGDDLDGDGISDAQEQAWALAYFPYYAIAPNDNCAQHGVVYRLAPHPQDAQLIMIWYVVLYQRDCGALGHLGDVETFGVVADPRIAAPAGILGIRAISHQGTLCQRITSCGSLPNCAPCSGAQRDGKPYPVVFASRDKHGQYAQKSSCDQNFLCDLGGCALSPTPDLPLLVNAGEPQKPLTNNLTTAGMITAANGWTETQLYDFDPWGSADFGNVGTVSEDLVDGAYVIDPQQGC